MHKKNKFDLQIDIKAPDKSISHRSVIFALLSSNTCRVKNFLYAQDTICSLNIACLLGLRFSLEDCKGQEVKLNKDLALVESSFFKDMDLILYPPSSLKEPSKILECGNSGTSIRLFTGFLSSSGFYCVLSGDKYLHKRPMSRVVTPLNNIGARIATRVNGLAPLSILPSKIDPFSYKSNISSAQVKSALIFASLNSKSSNISQFEEISLSRDHTENMLLAFQDEQNLLLKDSKIFIKPLSKKLKAFDISIPNDPSSAFFFAVACMLIEGSKICLKNVLLNDTRIEAFKVLQKMGAKISYENIKDDFEKVGDIVVYNSALKAISIEENISWLIDEVPALALAFSVAKGESSIKNAKELRVKESDRIKSTLALLQSFGLQTKEFEDGFSVLGAELRTPECILNSFGDHRIAMSGLIGAFVVGGEVDDIECIKTSFPNFFDILSKLRS